jgi:hypothetical protein
MTEIRQRLARALTHCRWHLACLVVVSAATPLIATQLHAQVIDSATVSKVLEAQKQLAEQGKSFKFGLSLGYRRLIGSPSSFVRDAVLNPADSTVQVDTIDHGAMILSGVVVAFPWKRAARGAPPARHPNAWRIGFLANINLASFANAEISTFNRSIEGGGGLALRMSDDFALALTFERVFSRRLWSFVEAGKKLPHGPNAAAGSFKRDDDTYFRNDNLSALSAKFVYFFR